MVMKGTTIMTTEEMTKIERDEFGKDRMNHWYEHCLKHGKMAMSWHQFKIVYSHGLDADPERKIK
tara:strand:+ start:313 stop:507 length:195 start_codon:yes stop_codon:yes gene_type:complete